MNIILKRLLFLVITLLTFFLFIHPVPAQTGGGREPKEDISNIPPIGDHWAVFIAIDEYKKNGRLENPVKDARKLKETLEEYYYINKWECLINENATAENILKLFDKLRNETKPNDSVFIFHSGHGIKNDKTKISAWIPFDGDSATSSYSQANWLSHSQIRIILDSFKARHVFLISDSCYSGDLVDLSKGETLEIIRNYPAAYNNVSRQIMSSGASQKVPDESEFNSRLINTLLRTEKAYITPDYLLSQIKEVETARKLSTVPILSVIPLSSHENGGSFLFFRKKGTDGFGNVPTKNESKVTPVEPFRGSPGGNFATSKITHDNMVLIEGGSFMMGSHPSSDKYHRSDESQHSVEVSSFYMGIYPVTQSEYIKLMGGHNPSIGSIDNNFPVFNVRWLNAVNYCNYLTDLDKSLARAYSVEGTSVTWIPDANGYRLPTEAEWEYACRAGMTTPYSTGESILISQANYDGKKITEVKSYSPNPWGLYNMHGNVWELCWDVYERDYSKSENKNPKGSSGVSVPLGLNHVIRGGCWNSPALDLRSASRLSENSLNSNNSSRSNYIGFRIVRNL